MKKRTYNAGKMYGAFCDSNELLAKMLISRKPPKTISIKKNIKYGTLAKEKYDLIYQNETNLKMPLMIYVHGGGFISGGTSLRRTYCVEYAKQGFIVANIDYDNAPKKVFPHQLQQCLDFVDHIYDNADRYNIDMSKILVAGESAGGYFLSYLATISKDKSLVGKLGLRFKNNDRFDVTALVSICPAVDIVRLCDSKFAGMKTMIRSFTDLEIKDIKDRKDTDEIKLLSPQIEANFPPTMLISAKLDKLKPEALAIKEIMTDLGIEHKHYDATGMTSLHAFAIAVCLKKGKECLDETLEFVLPYFDMA